MQPDSGNIHNIRSAIAAPLSLSSLSQIQNQIASETTLYERAGTWSVILGPSVGASKV